MKKSKLSEMGGRSIFTREPGRAITTTDTYLVKKAGRGNFKLHEVKLPYNKKSNEVMVVRTVFGKPKRDRGTK